MLPNALLGQLIEYGTPLVTCAPQHVGCHLSRVVPIAPRSQAQIHLRSRFERH